jgi:hypothetical protein
MSTRKIIFGVSIVCIAITITAADHSTALLPHSKGPHKKFIWVTKHDAVLVQEAYKEKKFEKLVTRISQLTQRVYDFKIQLKREKEYSLLLITRNTASNSRIARLTQQVHDFKKQLDEEKEFKSILLSQMISIASNRLGASSMQSSVLLPDDRNNLPVDPEYVLALEGSFSSSDDENPGESSNGAEK